MTRRQQVNQAEYMVKLIAMVRKLSDYLETANQLILEDAGGDEEDYRDAEELIAEARELVKVS